MVNETGNSYWLYSFVNNLPENRDSNGRWLPFPSLYIYAHSEEEARRKFKDEFGFEAGKMYKRDPW